MSLVHGYVIDFFLVVFSFPSATVSHYFFFPSSLLAFPFLPNVIIRTHRRRLVQMRAFPCACVPTKYTYIYKCIRTTLQQYCCKFPCSADRIMLNRYLDSVSKCCTASLRVVYKSNGFGIRFLRLVGSVLQ